MGTDGREGSAAGLSLSVCMLIVLSMGGHYVWVVRRRPWMGSSVGGMGHCLQVLGCRWAHSRGQVVCGCWFVVHGRGGDVSSAVWSSLVRLEGTRVGVLTIDDSIDNNNE